MAAYAGLKPGVNVKYAVEFRTAHRAVATARKRYEMQGKLSAPLQRHLLNRARSVICLNVMPRCAWATTEPAITYHDEEWGVPVHDDRVLFEFLILEGAQAGLSWNTILKKRENYRKAFDGFRPEKIARYNKRDVQRLLRDDGIVRNRLKIAAAIENAKKFLVVKNEFGSFDAYLWTFVGGAPIQNRWRVLTDVPARTAESDAMSRDLLQRGFKFVGSTICYAFMQATGMVNDHLTTCPRHAKLGGSHQRRTTLKRRKPNGRDRK